MSGTTAEAVHARSDRGSERAHEAIAAQMYAMHYAAVFRYVRSRVRTQAEAEDLTGDVFCRAVAGLKNYRPMRSSALPWLYTIAAHRVIDHYRAARPTSELDETALVDGGSPNPADVVVTQDQVREVWELSKCLPPSQRRALWLRYGEELELREIALLMGRSVEAVKLLVHRAIRGVRGNLLAPVRPSALSLLPTTGRVTNLRWSAGRRTGRGSSPVKAPAPAAPGSSSQAA
ncbi:MAG TPA: sigma-70 family RNA polymerase sigma factor [Candidatus Acidoferrales bacterium]|nr:sigma-70 family RNA polymerase sigma factor [Candidatus Acidoferrales bacterium]